MPDKGVQHATIHVSETLERKLSLLNLRLTDKVAEQRELRGHASASRRACNMGGGWERAVWGRGLTQETGSNTRGAGVVFETAGRCTFDFARWLIYQTNYL